MTNQYDLIVVGTGFASAFFLKKYLSRVPKTRVLVLERGHVFPAAERRKVLAGEKSTFEKVNPLADATYVTRNPDKRWEFTVGFGGSSNCWYACTPRFMPSDFRMKSLYNVAEDWPVQYDDLETYYTEVEGYMHISGPSETPFPKHGPYPLPAHTFSTVDQILHKQYGNLYISQPTARASRAVNGRNACCASTVCSVCPVNAKFTIENSNLGVFDDPRVELRFGTNVYALDLVNGIAKKVLYHQNGRDHAVAADIVALGAHAIFNANILLNSNDANRHTGKGLGEQLGMDAVVYLDNLENAGGSTWVTANGYMLYEGDHRKEYAACLMESNNAPYIRVERGKWRHVATFRMIFEDLPMDHNFVGRGNDRFLPEVHFKGPSSYALKSVEKMKASLPKILSVLPVEKIEFKPFFKSEAHILGTTRMSADAATGVVDKNLIHHHVRNLFVLGSGSFTTYSPNNPTLTLSALSLMAADRSF